MRMTPGVYREIGARTALRFLCERRQPLPKARPAGKSQTLGRAARVVDTIDRLEHAPAAPEVNLAIVREVARHYGRRVGHQVRAILTLERRARHDDEGIETERGRAGQRGD